MTDPTTLGEVAPVWALKMAEAQARAEDPCGRHPEHKTFDCPGCAFDRREAARQERFEDVALIARERCEARFPRRYAGAASPQPQVQTWVDAYLAEPEEAPSLLLAGPTGTGKTWQAYAALRAAVTTPREAGAVGFRTPMWHAATYADILASLRPSSGNDTEETLKRYREVGVLLIDDLGVAKVTEWSEETTYRLLNHRYEDMRPCILTSNLLPSQLRDSLGDRIASRLQETCTVVTLTGPDRRRARPGQLPIGASA